MIWLWMPESCSVLPRMSSCLAKSSISVLMGDSAVRGLVELMCTHQTVLVTAWHTHRPAGDGTCNGCPPGRPFPCTQWQCAREARKRLGCDQPLPSAASSAQREASGPGARNRRGVRQQQPVLIHSGRG